VSRSHALSVYVRASVLTMTSSSQLEATYCDLEILDNSTPEVVELRQQRIERAMWINDRLIALGDGHEDEMEESEDEDEEDSDEEDEAERLAKRLGKQQIA